MGVIVLYTKIMQAVWYISTVDDGSMKSSNPDFKVTLPARRKFLEKNNIDIQNTTLVRLTYDGGDFCRYRTLHDGDKGDGMTRPTSYGSAALVVTTPDHALFLPLADCIGAVIHDPTQNILMLSDLGRHNLEQYGGTKSIEYLAEKHGCNPANLTVWLSPAAGKSSYPLYAFDNRSLHDVATEQLQAAGIPATNITVSPTDSATDPNYFSHSQFLAGTRHNDGRHAVVAVIR